MSFPFEKLIAYQKGLSWVTTVSRFRKTAPIGLPTGLGDQLSRAALSIPLNISEGVGRWHPKEKRQFFFIARGSVFECVALTQVLRSEGILPDTYYRELYAQLVELARLLSGLIRATKRE